jgi:hypothetical protein
MKKLLLIVGLAALSFTAKAETFTTVVNGNVMTNLLAARNGSIAVSQILLTATSSNTAVRLFDNTTNLTYKVIPPYTNNFSYVTNLTSSYTNYFGVINYYTNTVLVDITNNVTAAYTNYTSVVDLSALANTTATANGAYYFHQGIWATNVSAGNATVTITYRQ